MADFLVTVQINTVHGPIPTAVQFKDWTLQTLKACGTTSAEFTVRLVDESESATLNEQYRHKIGPTNVLSFPYDTFTNGMSPNKTVMGDIVICAPIVIQEALRAHKIPEAHFAHMVVHGTLHVLGYDHETDAQALVMHPIENKLLVQLGFDAPYGESNSL